MRNHPRFIFALLLGLTVLTPLHAESRPRALDKPLPENIQDLRVIQERVKKVAAKVMPCVVGIRIGQAAGSGVLINKDGYVLTAGHISGKPDRDVSVILPDGRRVKGKTLGSNVDLDSGLIRITDKGDWPFVEMGDDSNLKPGAWCLALGHPEGYRRGRTPVLRLGRVLERTEKLIRTDCALVGGDSGGPLFDLDGKVIGIHSRIGNSMTINIHVPVDTYRTTWDRLAKGEEWGGRKRGPYIGVTLKEDDRKCRIAKVDKDSPAEKAGLQADDVVIGFGKSSVEDVEDLLDLIAEHKPGEEVPIRVRRGKEIHNLKVVIGRHRGSAAAYEQRMRRSNVLSKTSDRFLAAFRDVGATASLSTVRIWLRLPNNDKEQLTAYGIIVGADGWILTKASDLRGEIICELIDSREFPAQIVGVSEPYDLAMLKIEAKGLSPIQWHDGKNAAVGSWVATPGLNRDPAAVGVLSVAARKITGPELARRSSSGGFLGVSINPAKSVKNGVKIDEVIPGGAAAKAGFEEGDIIIAVGKKAITDAESLFKALQSTKPGHPVVVRVKRGSEEVELKPILDPRPMDRADVQNQLGSKLSDHRTGFPMVLQHDTILRPEDCGGPLVDLDGRVIGINIARSGRTETLAIPAEAVKPLLDDLKSGKLAPPK